MSTHGYQSTTLIAVIFEHLLRQVLSFIDSTGTEKESRTTSACSFDYYHLLYSNTFGSCITLPCSFVGLNLLFNIHRLHRVLCQQHILCRTTVLNSLHSCKWQWNNWRSKCSNRTLDEFYLLLIFWLSFAYHRDYGWIILELQHFPKKMKQIPHK